MYSVTKWMLELKTLKNRVAIILAGAIDLELSSVLTTTDYIVAIDGGYNHLLNYDIQPDILIGDLDSIKVKPECDVIELNPIKDDTDFIAGLNFVTENYPELPITVYGFNSLDRLDHVIANLAVLRTNTTYVSKNQTIELIDCSVSVIKDQYQYISFFSFDVINEFSLTGFKYPLTNYELKPFDPLCVSNELIANCGQISISNGSLIMIKSKKN